jgi:uncharacterized protein (TIGR03067 family)
MIANAALALLTVVAIASDAPDEAVKKEKEKLQGTWVVESAEVDGNTIDDLKGVKMVFAGDKVTWRMDGIDREVTYSIDPTKSPKHIDFTFEGKCVKTVGKDVYQLEGDTLKVCNRAVSATFDKDGKLIEEKVAERPEKLDSKDGILLILKRHKK